MRHEDKNNIAGETNALSSDERNVSRLLANLKRVDAPKDFDFHLKARIANASPGRQQPVRLFPVLKYALPLALFLVIGAAFVLTNSYDVVNVPEVTTISNTSAPASEPEPMRRAESDSVPERPADKVLVAEGPERVGPDTGAGQRTDARMPLRPRGSIASTSPGGSFDSTGKESPKVHVAPFLRASNSNSTRNPDQISPIVPLQFRQVLMSLGIDASDTGEKTWKVMRLTKDGIAARSGLREGDVMEAIDGKPIRALYDGTFNASSISVRREGKPIKIDLRFQ